MSSLLDETTTWAEFGKQYFDRRITKAITKHLGLERPTLVQSKGIPVALEGKDVLVRARTGSGKTLCYALPMVQRVLREVEKGGDHRPLRGVVLVPSKELCVQVHAVIASLLSFSYDVLTAEHVIPGQTYMKAELPTILVSTPGSLLKLLSQKGGKKSSSSPGGGLTGGLIMLVVDEADLMFSFGYEDDMKSVCDMFPSKYQSILVSATLSEEV